MSGASLARASRVSGRQLLSRLLQEPQLASVVRALPPRALHEVVKSVGLDDAGEILAFASTEQLTRLFDEDAWTEDTFDAARFALWLEVLAEAGADTLAERFAELPEALALHALAELVLVVNTNILDAQMQCASRRARDRVENVLENALYEEIDAYLVLARVHDGWDTIVALLLALDERDHDALLTLLERLSAAAVSDDDDVMTALTAAQEIASDAAAERDDRRADEGYVSSADARAFLRLARENPPGSRDVITQSYLRSPRGRPAQGATAAPRPRHSAGGLLLPSGSGRSALGAPDHALATPQMRAFHTYMRELDSAAHAARLEELAYLANVLLAAGEATRMVEAGERVLEVCERGLARISASQRATVTADWLFRAGSQPPAP